MDHTDHVAEARAEADWYRRVAEMFSARLGIPMPPKPQPSELAGRLADPIEVAKDVAKHFVSRIKGAK